MTTLVLAVLIAGGPAMAPGALAQSDAAAAKVPRIGAQVKDGKGQAVGRVEKVILGRDGQAQQVLVRVDRVLRTLPVEALSPSGADYVSVLSRAEIAALPPSD